MDGRASAARTLVGRDAEILLLQDLMSAAAGGRGGTVWIQGEPGIGKTALLTDALSGAVGLGCQRFHSRADETSPMSPLGPLLGALNVGPGSTDAARSHIASALWGNRPWSADAVGVASELLVVLVEQLCVVGPVILAIDDLQWADTASLAVWGRLSHLTGQLPLLLIAAVRPVPQREEVLRLRRATARVNAVSIDLALQPLDTSEVTAMAREMLSATPGPTLLSIVERAGGNPLYVSELIDAMRRDGRLRQRDELVDLVPGTASPGSLASAIGQRLTFLSEGAARLMRRAALLGAEFSVSQLSAMTGEPVTALSELIGESIAAGVLAESGTQLVFRHTLIHQALYESMPQAVRIAMHRQAAQSLAQTGFPADAVAAQLLLAGPGMDDDWAVAWLTEAAVPLILRAPEFAAELLERARQNSGLAEERRLLLEVRLIEAHFHLSQHEKIVELGTSVLSGLRDPNLLGPVARAVAISYRFLGRLDDCLQIVDGVLAVSDLPLRWVSRLRGLRASYLFASKRYAEAREAAELAAAEGQRAGDRAGIAQALQAQALIVAYDVHDQAGALSLIERALAILGDGLEDTDLRLSLLTNQAASLFNVGRKPEARRALSSALMLAEQAGATHRLATLRLFAADFCFVSGQWDDCLAELESLPEVPHHKPAQLWRDGMRALIAVYRDETVAEDGEELSGWSAGWARQLRSARALAADRRGQPELALKLLLEMLDPEGDRKFSQRGPDEFYWLPSLARIAIGVGKQEIARAAAEAYSDIVEKYPLPENVAFASHVSGLAYGDPARVRTAAAGYAHEGFLHMQGTALEDAAVLLAEKGDLTEARESHGEAVAIYTKLEAAWDIRRADARLRPFGLRRGSRGARRRPKAGWDALTPTEVKVANLLSDGKSNPDIAVHLYLSRRTVECHVSHILTKLECRSRIEVARRVRVAGG
jgi:DNA-binding CsgD family transcriptional regulator